ncbi:MAG: aminotransferase class V-fold PLP-dependent enzyme [Defluviitaleaceae bacterium]|nr:aminotransferase class V-fold PLP-dependent enzyme [Defluviitaleaceae bacterium]
MIYLDHAATTPPLQISDVAAQPFYANPSSPHAAGIAAERTLTQARAQLAAILSCDPRDVFFTSGGTEGNNMAVLGFALSYISKTRHGGMMPSILVEPWAHPSVLAPAQHAAQMGYATVTVASATEWAEKITAAPTLACLSHINHETGDRTDIPALAQKLKSANPQTVIFTDGAQGFCKDPQAASVYNASDIYTISGHKIHASGGCITIRKPVKLAPLFHGGGQEANLRAGTENVASAVSLAQAAQFLHAHCNEHHTHIALLNTNLAAICHEIAATHINAAQVIPPGATLHEATLLETSPHILNLSFLGTRGEVLVHMLSERGIYVSMGAACKSRNKRDTSSLALMGYAKDRAESAVRFSFAHMNTLEEVKETKHALVQCVAQLRKVSGWRLVAK